MKDMGSKQLLGRSIAAPLPRSRLRQATPLPVLRCRRSFQRTTLQIAPIPLVLLRLLPSNAAEQEALRADTKRSLRGGAAFVSVLVGSLVWTVGEAVYVLTSSADEKG